jgi:hypothetical protein
VTNTRILYGRFMLMPIAYDQGKYAAMLIIEDEDGLQRATGVLGLFDDVNTACRYALEYGIGEVDDHDKHQVRRDWRERCPRPGNLRLQIRTFEEWLRVFTFSAVASARWSSTRL